jgi:hypothetical protein
MATGQPSDDLMQLLNFDSDDFKLNQKGELSFQQRLHVLTRIDVMPIFFTIALPVGAVIGGIMKTVTPIQVLVALILAVISASLSRTSFQIILTALEGKVVETSGTVTMRIYTHDRRTYAGMMGKKFANGIINNTSFVVPLEMASRYQGKPLRIFYTAGYHQAVSGEVLVK